MRALGIIVAYWIAFNVLVVALGWWRGRRRTR